MNDVTISESSVGTRIAVVITSRSEVVCTAARDRYLQQYHPLGYGTFLADVAYIASSGRYEAVGSRAASCD